MTICRVETAGREFRTRSIESYRLNSAAGILKNTYADVFFARSGAATSVRMGTDLDTESTSLHKRQGQHPPRQECCPIAADEHSLPLLLAKPLTIFRRVDEAKDERAIITRRFQVTQPVVVTVLVRVSTQVSEILHRDESLIEILRMNFGAFDYLSEHLCARLSTLHQITH